MDLRKRDGNVPHNRGCGELALGLLALVALTLLALVGAA